MTDRYTPDNSAHSPLDRAVASLAILGVFFALLLAASYPLPAATALGGAGAALALRRAAATIRSRGRVCVPGTERCLYATGR